MPVPRQLKAAIAGGSVGGLFIGNMLLRRGWAVEIFERATSGLESRGAGIAGHAELTAILQTIGVSSDRRPGIDVSGRVAFDRRGNQLASGRGMWPQHNWIKVRRARCVCEQGTRQAGNQSGLATDQTAT